MLGIKSTSSFGSINWTDVAKSLRAGGIALASAFVAGIVGVVPQLDIVTVMRNPRAIVSMVILAGLTSAFDLVRRYLTEYSAPSA